MQVTLTALKLTTKVYKQIREETDYDRVKLILAGKEGEVLGYVLEDYQNRLIVKTGDGEYIKFYCHPESTKKFKQIFLA